MEYDVKFNTFSPSQTGMNFARVTYHNHISIAPHHLTPSTSWIMILDIEDRWNADMTAPAAQSDRN